VSCKFRQFLYPSQTPKIYALQLSEALHMQLALKDCATYRCAPPSVSQYVSLRVCRGTSSLLRYQLTGIALIIGLVGLNILKAVVGCILTTYLASFLSLRVEYITEARMLFDVWANHTNHICTDKLTEQVGAKVESRTTSPYHRTTAIPQNSTGTPIHSIAIMSDEDRETKPFKFVTGKLTNARTGKLTIAC
jgi:hypothetical protein